MIGDPFEHYCGLLTQICREWSEAEADIKRAEQVSERVVFPAIKELRYGGRRLAQALQIILSNGDPGEISNYLQDALFNCRRARHDAIDAATAQMAIVVRLAEEKLGSDAAITAFPDFPHLVESVQEIRSKIVDSRRSAAERETIYSAIESAHFPELIKLYERFQRSEARMKAIARKQRIRDVVSVVSLLFGVIGVILSVWALT
jgi:hypothetical protein